MYLVFSTRRYSLRDSTGGYGAESTLQALCAASSPHHCYLQSDLCAGAFREHLKRCKHKNKCKYRFTKLTQVHTTVHMSSLYFVKECFLCTHSKRGLTQRLVRWMVEYCFDTFDQWHITNPFQGIDSLLISQLVTA